MYNRLVKSKPFLGISDAVVRSAKPLLDADDYHITHSARLARTAHILREMVAEVGEDCKVLELGTSGFIPVVLKSLFPSVTIDVTNFDTAVASEGESVSYECEVGLAGRSVGVRAFPIDLEYDLIPIDNETYDIVVCCEVIEHMEIDPMFMLAEVNRVLKTNGKLFVSTPNILSSRGFTKMLEGHAPYFFMQYHANREYHRHNYEYSVKQLWSVLKCAGFDPTVWTEDLFEDGLVHAVDALRDAGFKIDHVGDNILSIATKISEVVERYPRGLYV